MSVYGLTSHSTHIVISETSLSTQSHWCWQPKTRKQNTHPKHKKINRKKLPQLTKQSTLLFGTPSMTSGHASESVLFLQPRSSHGETQWHRNSH